MAFPQWQPSLSSEQVKFALGLKRPTIILTSVQTCFERQGKFLNFYEVYEYFWKIFLFLSHILIFHLKQIFFYEFSWSLWVFLENFFFFLVILIFYFKKFFSWMFMKFMNIFERFFLFWVIYWFFISYSMAQRTSTEVLRMLRPRTERVNYLDYLDCLKVMNFLVNVWIFLFRKSANWHLKLKHFFCSHHVRDFFRKNTLPELYNAFWKNSNISFGSKVMNFLVNVCIFWWWVCLSLKIKYLFEFFCNLYDVPFREKCSSVYRNFTRFVYW